MAIKLKDGEKIKTKVNFHWSSYLGLGIWALVWTPILIQIAQTRKADATFIVCALIAYFPVAHRWLQNRFKTYVVTNLRIYIEEGIIAKSKRDIPLNKVNDLELSQGFIQRLFGAGNISILTGNDRPAVLAYIDDPEKFKDSAAALIGRVA